MKESNMSFSTFHDYFIGGQYKNNFSYEGLRALYDYLEEYEDSTETEIEFDIVAFACEYTEYEDVEEYISNYGDVVDKEDYTDENTKELDEDDYNEAVKEYIRDHTQLIEFEEGEGFIIVAY